jgi:putative transcriptional regulator
MKITRSAIEGLALLALALVFFTLPHYMESPRAGDDKLLLATPSLKGGPFEGAVILVVQHNGYGALGFVLNKPSAHPSDPVPGGPVCQDKYYTLHSLDVTDGKTHPVDGLSDLGLTEGETFARSLGTMAHKPSEYIIFKGCAQWGMGQLTREIEQNVWKVVPFDRELVFHAAPAQIFDAASKK